MIVLRVRSVGKYHANVWRLLHMICERLYLSFTRYIIIPYFFYFLLIVKTVLLECVVYFGC